MQLTWLGHSGFRLEIADQVFLIDPWLRGNPSFPEERYDEAIEGATAIIATHGHFDHINDTIDIARERNIPIIGIFDLTSFLDTQSLQTIGFNKGGQISIGEVKLHMVNACHSNSMQFADEVRNVGSEAGYMIEAENHMIYLSGDTTIMADMEWMADYYKPDIGILCAGGHFTMDMKMVAYAANRYFNFDTIIPCHYKTFPILAQNADDLKANLNKGEVIEPEVMGAITL